MHEIPASYVGILLGLGCQDPPHAWQRHIAVEWACIFFRFGICPVLVILALGPGTVSIWGAYLGPLYSCTKAAAHPRSLLPQCIRGPLTHKKVESRWVRAENTISLVYKWDDLEKFGKVKRTVFFLFFNFDSSQHNCNAKKNEND